MNLASIRVRYSLLFAIIAVFFVISTLMNFALINKTEGGIVTFSQKFNPAISAVLNADRDLYQARVAELQILMTAAGSSTAGNSQSDFEENAQQAYDRMKKYKGYLSDYPDILSKLRQFDTTYNEWKQNAGRVFELAMSGQVDQARILSEGASLDSFNKLRDFYDIAGEAADNKSKSESEETINSVGNRQAFLVILSLIVVGSVVTLGVIAPKRLSDVMLNLTNEIEGLNSGDGNLTRRINSSRKDEVGLVAAQFDELMNGLAELIGSICNQSSEVIQSVDKLDAGASHIRDTSMQQTEKVEVIVTAVNEMTYAIKKVAENAQLTADEIEEVNNLTNEGSQITHTSVREIEKLSDTVENATQVISKLSENSADIASVIDVIRGIAEQTNLLALNAAIEAARAGEQGRGFAVVADEVRTLASRTQESTQSIQNMIESLQAGVEEAVKSISKGSEATKSTVELSQQTLAALDKITEASAKVSDVAIQTATATEEQSQVAEDISHNLTILADQTRENLAEAEQNGEMANHASQQATALSNNVTRFKLS